MFGSVGYGWSSNRPAIGQQRRAETPSSQAPRTHEASWKMRSILRDTLSANERRVIEWFRENPYMTMTRCAITLVGRNGESYLRQEVAWMRNDVLLRVGTSKRGGDLWIVDEDRVHEIVQGNRAWFNRYAPKFAVRPQSAREKLAADLMIRRDAYATTERYLRTWGNIGISPALLLPAQYADEGDPVIRERLKAIANELGISLKDPEAN